LANHLLSGGVSCGVLKIWHSKLALTFRDDLVTLGDS
jgi:hypothetical protein